MEIVSLVFLFYTYPEFFLEYRYKYILCTQVELKAAHRDWGPSQKDL